MAYMPLLHCSEPGPGQVPEFAQLIENGRRYGKQQYLFPIDTEESTRLDTFHAVFHAALRNQLDGGQANGLHVCPLPLDRPVRVLDLGCGTGIWCLHMAEHYQNAKFVGLDCHKIQPTRAVGNVEFHQQDITKPHWEATGDSFDLVYMRMLAGTIGDWQLLYQTAFERLRCGGVLEHIELDFRPRSIGSTNLSDSSLDHWATELYDAFRASGLPLDQPDARHLLERVGFADIEHLQLVVPYRPRPGDSEGLQLASRWLNIAVTQDMVGMSMAALTRFKDYTYGEVIKLTRGAQAELHAVAPCNLACTMHVWTARRL